MARDAQRPLPVRRIRVASTCFRTPIHELLQADTMNAQIVADISETTKAKKVGFLLRHRRRRVCLILCASLFSHCPLFLRVVLIN